MKPGLCAADKDIEGKTCRQAGGFFNMARNSDNNGTDDTASRENTFDFKDLGRKIKVLRLKKGLTQNEVAQALHVTPGYISNVENDRTAMSLRVLSYYAKLMGITLDSLVGEIEPEYTETALDNELLSEISTMKNDDKKRLLRTIKIWKSSL